MSDQAPGPAPDRLGSAIDRTVRRLMRRDAPANLRARVLARLAQPSRSSWVLTPRRAALAGAVVALALAAAVVLPRWRERGIAPRSESRTATSHPALPPAATVRRPGRGPAVAPAAEGTRTAGPQRRAPARALGAAALVARSEDRVVIDPLPAPESITIAPLESGRVRPLHIDIAPLEFEVVQIEPLQVPR